MVSIQTLSLSEIVQLFAKERLVEVNRE